MKYLIALFLAAPAVHAAKPEQFMIEAKIIVAGQVVSTPKLSTLAGEKSIIKQRKPGAADLIAVEVVAQSLKNSRAHKLQIDMKFSGERVGNHQQKFVAISGEEKSVTFKNAKGELVEIQVSARRL